MQVSIMAAIHRDSKSQVAGGAFFGAGTMTSRSPEIGRMIERAVYIGGFMDTRDVSNESEAEESVKHILSSDGKAKPVVDPLRRALDSFSYNLGALKAHLKTCRKFILPR